MVTFTLSKHKEAIMNFQEYQQTSQLTAGHLNGGDPILNVAISALGLVGESGEVSEHIKKFTGHGHNLDKDKVTKELGDVLWYLTDLATQLDIKLEDVALTNIKKLQNRYPDGFPTR